MHPTVVSWLSCSDLFYDGTSEEISLEYFSVGFEHGYVKYLILIVFRLIGGGLFHAPHRNSCMHTNDLFVSLFVTAIMHYTAS